LEIFKSELLTEVKNVHQQHVSDVKDLKKQITNLDNALITTLANPIKSTEQMVSAQYLALLPALKEAKTSFTYSAHAPTTKE